MHLCTYLSDSLFSTFSGNNFLCNNFILCLYLPGQLGAVAITGIAIAVALVVIVHLRHYYLYLLLQ